MQRAQSTVNGGRAGPGRPPMQLARSWLAYYCALDIHDLAIPSAHAKVVKMPQVHIVKAIAYGQIAPKFKNTLV